MKFWSITLATSLLSSLLISGTRAVAQTPLPSAQPNTPAGCLSGYPDGTYRGDRPMTRYEFAAGLNACFQQIDQTLRLNREQLATKEDFDRLIQRQRELNDQLRGLSDRLDILSE
ncbi:S-layer homology domain-containing protein [Pseudanabaenaceae cyanobacterium LEGE 13415]|nr:S-layer homology domain-containing protein [Pseudanabaenaceae cyanobacterium LEGE 13415]